MLSINFLGFLNNQTEHQLISFKYKSGYIYIRSITYGVFTFLLLAFDSTFFERPAVIFIYFDRIKHDVHKHYNYPT
jgi:hypothetical protein